MTAPAAAQHLLRVIDEARRLSAVRTAVLEAETQPAAPKRAG